MKVDYHSTIGEIAAAISGSRLYGHPETDVHTITTDSREFGEKNLFVPIIGEKFDGHQFVEPLAERGVLSGFLSMNEGQRGLAEQYNISLILCEDTLRAYGRIAGSHRDAIDPTVIGITGTNGKTTTKELISAVLSSSFNCIKNVKNYNNEIGVPFTLLGLKNHHKIAVVEMGMNHTGELNRLSLITKPDIAVITNIGEGHLEFLGSIENVAHAKSEIMDGMNRDGIVILNRDTQCFEILKKKAGDLGLTIKTFGLEGESDIHPESYRLFKDRIEITWEGDEIRVPLYGIHNVYNIAAALAVSRELGIENQKIRESLLKIKNVEMRSQVVEAGFIVVNDTYNSNPLSSHYSLMSISEIFPERRKLAVLSDMKELGESSEFYHTELGREVVRFGFDLLFAWGDMSEYTAIGARKAGFGEEQIFFFTDKDELIDTLIKRIEANDVILVKGSRSMKMEGVVDAIVQ